MLSGCQKCSLLEVDKMVEWHWKIQVRFKPSLVTVKHFEWKKKVSFFLSSILKSLHLILKDVFYHDSGRAGVAVNHVENSGCVTGRDSVGNLLEQNFSAPTFFRILIYAINVWALMLFFFLH